MTVSDDVIRRLQGVKQITTRQYLIACLGSASETPTPQFYGSVRTACDEIASTFSDYEACLISFTTDKPIDLKPYGALAAREASTVSPFDLETPWAVEVEEGRAILKGSAKATCSPPICPMTHQHGSAL
jgi:hypothetical protein